MEAGVYSSLLCELPDTIKLEWESGSCLTHSFLWLTFSLHAPLCERVGKLWCESCRAICYGCELGTVHMGQV